MLNWVVWNWTVYLYKIDLALNNLKILIYHKFQPTNQVQSIFISFPHLHKEDRYYLYFSYFLYFSLNPIPLWGRFLPPDTVSQNLPTLRNFQILAQDLFYWSMQVSSQGFWTLCGNDSSPVFLPSKTKYLRTIDYRNFNISIFKKMLFFFH